jgi:hypothetical protein
MLAPGDYTYEIRLDGQVVAFEETHLQPVSIVASRRSVDGLSRHRLEAALDADHRVCRVGVSYSTTLFTRKASYEAVEDHLRGHISGLAARNEVAVKLGRLREVDAAGFLIFRALIVSHMLGRGDDHWTGRVAVIDPTTLGAASLKQNCFRQNNAERSWIYEARMGDAEHIELDQEGHIVRRRDRRGLSAELIARASAC